jgi:sporulation protein YlmC with PRC-barrel domain
MAQTFRDSSSRTDAGFGARSSSSRGYPAGTMPPDYDEDFRSYEHDRRRSPSERPRTLTGLALDDVIILLGIVIGGTAGYMAASSVNSDRVGRRAWSKLRGSGSQARMRHQDRRQSRGSVEHDETTDLIASNKVESTPVYNRRGEKLGEVYNFMVGKRSGQVSYAVMSFGGFLGIGQKYHPLPWTMLTYDTSKKGYVVDVDKDQLMGAPSYGAGEEPFAQPNYGRDVKDYWSSRRTGTGSSALL